MINAIFVEGLIYAIMVLGIFITFRILDFPDLTVDGSFATGGCVMAICMIKGVDLYLGLSLAIMAGVIAGVFTALLHTQLKIPNLLAGIITMTMLYSINTRIIENKGYVSLTNYTNLVTSAKNYLKPVCESIFLPVFNFIGSVFAFILNGFYSLLIMLSNISDVFQDFGDYYIKPLIDSSLSMNEAYLSNSDSIALLVFFILIVLAIKILLDIFFRTDLGISLGALGSNEQMILSQGMNPNSLKILGVGISNGLVALSGALLAQFTNSASNINGQGIIIIGLASVMIGEFIIRSNRIILITLGVLIGSIIYKAIIFFGLKYGYLVGFEPNDLKLISGILIILIIMFSKLKGKKSKKVLKDMADSIYQQAVNISSIFKKDSKDTDETILSLENVSKVFLEGTVNEKLVLKNINLKVNKGDFITIIGSNGAGKSTLFNTIAGTYPITSGSIKYKGKDISKMKEFKRAMFMGRIFQNPLLGTSGSMALEDNMILCRKKGMKFPKISLTKSVRDEFKEHVSRLNMGLENRLEDNVGLFSGGQRQALTLLMTAMSHPKLVLLDEHTAALDPDNSNRVMELTLKLREEYDLTMMMITHNMQHAIEYGNRLIMMDNGEIILDISGEEKKNLTIEVIMEKFKAIRKDELNDEKLLLSL